MVLTFLLVFLFAVRCTITDEVCKTPQGQDGVCVSIMECPSLLELSNEQPQRPESVQLLRNSTCGFNGSSFKVCCANDTNSANSLLPDIDLCGFYNPFRTFGGENPDLYEFPWVAVLEYNTTEDGTIGFFCGGVLISKRYVLTNIYCVQSSRLIGADLQAVRLGEFNLDTKTDCVDYGFGVECAQPYLRLEIEEIIIHEKFNEREGTNNMALIRLAQDVTFSDFIQPICLPKTAEDLNKNHTGKKLILSGWGESVNGCKTRIKIKQQVLVKPLSECFGLDRFGYKSLLCTNTEKVSGFCVSGVGGPLMLLESNQKRKFVRWYLAGIDSHYITTSRECSPAYVFTDVTKYIDWIVSHVKP